MKLETPLADFVLVGNDAESETYAILHIKVIARAPFRRALRVAV